MTMAPQDPVATVTFGCRLNAAESAVMLAHAAAAGLADAVVINSCAVTVEAVRKTVQTIRQVRRDRPTARVIVTGCAAQIEPQRFSQMPEVDHVIGNDAKMRAETYAALAGKAAPRESLDDIMSVRTSTTYRVAGRGSRTRGFVEVQNGCDHRCTFCIIPLGRGPSRSADPGIVIERVRHHVEAGAREVVLTGVDITSYGGDGPSGMTLGRLVRRILAEVPDLARLRLSSIDQVEADGELLRALAEEPRLMPHLHLSMQSGSDLILKRMKRRHTRAHSIGFAREARRLRPDVVLGADLIVGFPTESEAMFEQTAEIVDACGLNFLHVFPFSARPGTPAARMPQVPFAEIKERASRLRMIAADRRGRYLDSLIGSTVEILMEKGGRGRTPGYVEVEVDAPAGTLLEVAVTARQSDRLVGRVQS